MTTIPLIERQQEPKPANSQTTQGTLESLDSNFRLPETHTDKSDGVLASTSSAPAAEAA